MPSGLVEDTRPIILDTIDSTNAEALRRAEAGERGPLWIVAERQSTGRGRRGRSWVSPAGNLHATLLVIDPAPAALAPQLSFVAGVALHDAAAAAAPALAPRLALKWPNDLLCGGRKIAGILVEGGGDPVATAIGFGVNCREHPPDAEYPATDFASDGADVAATALFDLLAAAMTQRLCQWCCGTGFAAIRLAWLERAAGRGNPIRVRLADRELIGSFDTIDESGRLLLCYAGGTFEAIAAGEVFPIHGISAHTVGAGLTAEGRGGAFR
jgi:BirA family transcriptional regulator, biotin operon repressor / biotin---[acetyl-CoA-carboxylase] ligase